MASMRQDAQNCVLGPVGHALLTTFGLGHRRPASGTWGSLPPVALAGLERQLEIGQTLVDLDDLGEGPDGLDACAYFRDRFGTIPMLIVTANRSDDVSARAKAMDLDIVHKPVEPDALRTRLEALLSDKAVTA